MSDRESAFRDRYLLERRLAGGGGGTVYRGRRISTGRVVALKQIKKTEENKKMSDLLQTLQHPGLVPVLETVELEDELWLVMEFVEGQDLKTILEQKLHTTGNALAVREVLCFADQLCEVLQYLHNLPVPMVYGDLKPANMMVREDGRLILIDPDSIRPAGKAARTEETGTPGYAAPEQYSANGMTGTQADIYSLGITLYQLVSGKNPAEESFRYRKADLIGNGIRTVSSVKEKNRLLGLDRIIQQCISFRPEERYRSIQVLQKDLRYPERMVLPMVVKNRILNLGVTVLLFLAYLAGLFAIRSELQSRDLAEHGAAYCVEMARRKQISRDQGYQEQVFQEQLYETYGAQGETVQWWLTCALHLTPGDEEIFGMLLTQMLEDDRFSLEEQYRMRRLLDTVEAGYRQTQEQILLTDPEQYEDFACRIGTALYFYGEGNSAFQDAENWFSKVKHSERTAKAGLFRNLCRIHEETGKLSLQKQDTGISRINWVDYYHTLCALTEVKTWTGEKEDSEEARHSEDQTEIELCRELLSLFMERTAEVTKAGITEKELMDITKEIQKKHQSLGESAEAVLKKLSLMEIAGSDEQRR